MESTSSGCSLSSCSNLLNSGSMTSGLRKIIPRRIGRAANQKYSHQRRGLRLITANRISARIRAKNVPTSSSWVQSQNQEPQHCTDCSERRDKECQYKRTGKSKLYEGTI